MMGKPTKFNDMESGATSSTPALLSVEEVNRLVNARSLHDPVREFDSAGLQNERVHPFDKPSETPPLPMGS